MLEKEKPKYIDRLKAKYRLSIYNDQTLNEVFQLRLSRLNVISVVGSIAFFLIVSVILLIAYTPIREFIPGYPDANTRSDIVQNALMLDSLENEIRIRDRYFENINTIINGGIPKSIHSTLDSTAEKKDIDFSISIQDSLLRMQIEQEEQFNLSVFEDHNKNTFSSQYFYAPIKGIVTNSFNPDENHFGTDIVAGPNEVVKACLDGTVIMSSWTIETGYIIQIQHANNLISIYKHNAEILKKVGNQVKAGEAIAIIGNSGEITTGPHLHFELWHEGKAINPEEYIFF